MYVYMHSFEICIRRFLKHIRSMCVCMLMQKKKYGSKGKGARENLEKGSDDRVG